MVNAHGKIKAVPAPTAPPAAAPPADTAAPAAGSEPAPADNTLPDPTKFAKWALAGMLLVAALVGVIWNSVGHAGAAFVPSDTANFALFAGFYVAAQIIERLLQLVAPELPFWNVPEPLNPGGATPAQLATAKAAQVKADRAFAAQGLATILGVAASCGFGLFFLSTVGMQASHTVDTIATGLVIGAGTKPLHDLITAIQNQNTPVTGTSA
jgi:hypothetical protein